MRVLKRIKSMRTRGKTLEAIAEKLNGDGIPTKRGGRWYPTTVRRAVTTKVPKATG